MRILFLVKFYQPFDRGGSEWSTHDLAVLLLERGHQIIIMTPNYGSKSEETIEGIKIYRLPFPIKLKDPKDQITPFWTNNVVWFLISTFFCFWLILKEKIDIIHVHNNEFLPAAVISSYFFRKKTVATFRDYQALCNFGFCLWNKNKACNFGEYLTQEFHFFYQNYVLKKNIFKYFILYTAAIRARIFQKGLYFFAKKIDCKIAVSKKVAIVFNSNGIKGLKVIHNVIDIRLQIFKKINNEIIYVGKLSKGKGIDVLLKKIPEILKEIPLVQFKIIGSGYLEPALKEFVAKSNLKNKVEFLGQLNHEKVIKEIAKAAIVVVPSFWQEPLPRSVIESILAGTPVVATKVGGIPEIVKNGYYGIITKPQGQSLQKAIVEAFRKRSVFKANIRKDLDSLRNHFTKEVVDKYEKIYEGL